MKALIVDDEAYMVDYICKIADWEAYGFDQILKAYGGSLARDLIEKERPELLVTDIKMPKVSGLDLARYIHENRYPIKVVILSGYGEFEYAQQAIQYGVSEYLLKPVRKEEFLESLEKLFPKETESSVCGIVKAYVQEHYGEDLSLDLIADIVHLHPAYLSKVFKDGENINLSGYITEIRMEKAAEMLGNTDRKVQDVMRMVGYQKSQYFSKLFKEKYGVTPNEYKKSRQ
jgi:two-component system, response regulator YesN